MGAASVSRSTATQSHVLLFLDSWRLDLNYQNPQN